MVLKEQDALLRSLYYREEILRPAIILVSKFLIPIIHN